MALPSHWMDDLFGDCTDSAGAIAQAIIGAREFKAAVERAVQKALMARSAQQAARVKFIEVIADEISK